MLFFAEGFTFRNFLTDVFAVFVFVLWFWLLIMVIGDLFRRHDVSGWAKAIWVIALIVFPYLGIRVHDHSIEGHGRAKQPAGSTGT